LDPSGILRDVEWDRKTKHKGTGSRQEEICLGHAISSAVSSTKLPLYFN